MRWLFAVALAQVWAQNAAMQPRDLQTENRTGPLGMDAVQPRLSWTLPWLGAAQQAYQIRAATDPALLNRGVANLWESGKVLSAQWTQIRYGGPPLASRDRVAWQVRVWTPEGLSDWSEPARFEIGLLDSEQLPGRDLGETSFGNQPLELHHEHSLELVLLGIGQAKISKHIA